MACETTAVDSNHSSDGDNGNGFSIFARGSALLGASNGDGNGESGNMPMESASLFFGSGGDGAFDFGAFGSAWSSHGGGLGSSERGPPPVQALSEALAAKDRGQLHAVLHTIQQVQTTAYTV